MTALKIGLASLIFFLLLLIDLPILDNVNKTDAAPRVSINLRDGQKLSGTVEISGGGVVANTIQIVPCCGTEFSINGVTANLGYVASSEWQYMCGPGPNQGEIVAAGGGATYSWDTTTVPDGVYTVIVRATGDSTMTKAVDVVVENGGEACPAFNRTLYKCGMVTQSQSFATTCAVSAAGTGWKRSSSCPEFDDGICQSSESCNYWSAGYDNTCLPDCTPAGDPPVCSSGSGGSTPTPAGPTPTPNVSCSGCQAPAWNSAQGQWMCVDSNSMCPSGQSCQAGSCTTSCIPFTTKSSCTTTACTSGGNCGSRFENCTCNAGGTWTCGSSSCSLACGQSTGVCVATPTNTGTPTPIPTPNCSSVGAEESSIPGGGSNTINLSGCTNVTDVDPTPAPPQCSDKEDNDGDGNIDTADPNCHTGNNLANPYNPTDNSESGTNPQCSDGSDNADTEDALADTLDPDCHTDGNATNSSSYNPEDTNETTSSTDTARCSDGTVANFTQSTNSSSYTWTAPSTFCGAATTCSHTIVLQGPGGTRTLPAINFQVTPFRNIAGRVYLEQSNDNCASLSQFTGGVNIGLSGAGDDVSDASGNFTIGDDQICGNRTLTVNESSYALDRYRINGAAWSTAGMSGNTTGSFNTTSVPTVDICIRSAASRGWMLSVDGDMRFNALDNPISSNATVYGSTSSTSPSVFVSSSSNANLGSRGAAAAHATKQWIVNNENSFNKNVEESYGTMSYDFYKSRARQAGVTIQSLSSFCGAGGLTNCVLTNLPTGIYEANSALTITGYTHLAGAHVLILSEALTRVETDIQVNLNLNNLFILATKNNLRIDDLVGQTDPSLNTRNLDGYYTAQRSIILESINSGCQTGTPDRRLNVRGALVANSLNPFDTDGTGKVQNNRSLCAANDALYPTLRVIMRPDMLIQMSDFYKATFKRWREVTP